MFSMKKISTFFATLALILSVLAPYIPVSAQTVGTTEAERAILQQQLNQLEAEIKEKQAQLDTQKGQSKTLTGEITVLKSKIDTAKLNIQSKTLLIKKLSGEISETEGKIATLSNKIDEHRDSIGQLLRKTNEIDQANMVQVLLSGKRVTDFYQDIDSFASLKRELYASVNQIKETKAETEVVKTDLESKQDQELDAKATLEQQKKKVESDQATQQQLLNISKNKEKEYQTLIADRQAKADQIRARLFNLAGGGGAIKFGDAVTYAEAAGAATGVEPSFILSILTQESNLGANVGRCYLTVPETGEGIRVSTGAITSRVMKPDRDVQPFLSITASLGLDYTRTLVSCPFSTGYGGAMGPSQFIPSTWVRLRDRVSALIGGTPNPWNNRDAFFASALFLADLGANSQTYSGERDAACRYYSGRRCDNAAPANKFYGDQVMARKDSIQADIDYLKEYGVSRR
jgi:peptidoglycan hydrolase CwlO-like protein